MKKIIGVLLGLFLLTGCMNYTAKDAVKDYLDKYRNLDSGVLTDLETIIAKENLTDDQKDVYREILKKQYKDLSYEILEEEANGDETFVTVKIKVYDLYKAQSDAATYLSEHQDEFRDDDGNYSKDKYITYKLDKMKDTLNKIEYTITFTVTKEDNKYIVSQPTENDLLKIHGVYDYELD